MVYTPGASGWTSSSSRLCTTQKTHRDKDMPMRLNAHNQSPAVHTFTHFSPPYHNTPCSPVLQDQPGGGALKPVPQHQRKENKKCNLFFFQNNFSEVTSRLRTAACLGGRAWEVNRPPPSTYTPHVYKSPPTVTQLSRDLEPLQLTAAPDLARVAVAPAGVVLPTQAALFCLTTTADSGTVRGRIARSSVHLCSL